MICENCGKEHNCSYGSERFCSEKCAKGFSTKAKRKEINKKVSKKLKRYKKELTINEFKYIVSKSRSMNEAAKKLKIPFNSFKRIAIELGLYTKNQGWSKDLVLVAKSKESYIENYLTENNKKPDKEKLFYFGIKEKRCEGKGCKLTDEWNGKPLVLHLDHINGNNKDQRLENLRILCPNCHSQTETYCRGQGKNKVS